MTTRMLRNAIVATALIGAIATPSAMACGHGSGGSSGPPPSGGTYKQFKGPSSYTGGGRHVFRGGRGDCNPTPPVVTPPVTPPVDPPPVDPPTGPAL